MKKFLIAIFTLFFYTSSFSQKLKLSELIKLTNYNLDEFDTYVTKNNFNFQQREDFDGYSVHKYTSNKNIDAYSDYYISKTIFESNHSIVIFQTMYKEDYLNLKTEISLLGFKYIGTEKSIDENGTFLIYKNKSIEIKLISAGTDSNKGVKMTAYSIWVVI